MRKWVFTTKPSHFKMSEALVPGETLDWPTFGRFKFEVGDLVFFYASSPVLQMIGKLEIEALDLNFSEVNPRNDLRKWPKAYSKIPWMRLRVLQSAPVPFKLLQRGSLYYHTEFKPSPYPKLLHENETEYVMRAFDEAMTYSADMVRYEGGIDPVASARVTRGEILKATAESLKGGHIAAVDFNRSRNNVKVIVALQNDEPSEVTFTFSGVKRLNWAFETADDNLFGMRLTLEDTYLLTHFDGSDLEILSSDLQID